MTKTFTTKAIFQIENIQLVGSYEFVPACYDHEGHNDALYQVRINKWYGAFCDTSKFTTYRVPGLVKGLEHFDITDFVKLSDVA